jgi:hypothetical protein
MNDDAPGSPDVEVTVTLGALAARLLIRFCSPLRTICAESIEFRTVPSFSTSETAPRPVTTISPSWSGLASREKSRVCSTPASTTRVVRGLYPMSRAVTLTVSPVSRAVGSAMVYLPSALVVAPSPQRSITTVACPSGSPSAEVTRPINDAPCC